MYSLRVAHTKRKPQPYRSLREWRAAKGLTMAEAAEILGYSKPGYQKLEHGQRHPRPDDLRRILTITGVPIEVLAGVA